MLIRTGTTLAHRVLYLERSLGVRQHAGKTRSNTTVITMMTNMTIDPALVEAVSTWLPRGAQRPTVGLESRTEGLRVRLVYLGVETGVLFARDGWGTRASVHRCLDRLFDILSWRVTAPADPCASPAVLAPSFG
jgi:hypothetical protein